MALAGLRVPGVTILDPGCVGKTYPAYWRDLASLGVMLEQPDSIDHFNP
jgi:3-phosphoshikimate 1-carboxyvinyltransferase